MKRIPKREIDKLILILIVCSVTIYIVSSISKLWSHTEISATELIKNENHFSNSLSENS